MCARHLIKHRICKHVANRHGENNQGYTWFLCEQAEEVEAKIKNSSLSSLNCPNKTAGLDRWASPKPRCKTPGYDNDDWCSHCRSRLVWTPIAFLVIEDKLRRGKRTRQAETRGEDVRREEMVNLMEDKLARSIGVDWEEGKEDGFGKHECAKIRERGWGKSEIWRGNCFC